MSIEKEIYKKIKLSPSEQIDRLLIENVNLQMKSDKKSLGMILGFTSMAMMLFLIFNVEKTTRESTLTSLDKDIANHYDEIELMTRSSDLTDDEWKSINEEVI